MLRKLATFAVAVPLMGGGVWAAYNAEPQADKVERQNIERSAALVRATSLMGMKVYNHQGQKLGDIDDIVLDGNTNHVSYVVLSYGGILGVGDKLFAVPWNALEYRHLEPKKLFLDATDTMLKDAPGFDKKQWPDMAGTAFRERVDQFYAAQRRDRDRDNADAGLTSKSGPEKKGLVWCRRVSAIKGADVKNNSGENLGDIQDLVLNAHDGQVRYAVLSFGGILGIGDKLFAIPMSSLQTDSAKKEFILNVPKEQLKKAPGFNSKDWPDFADTQFLSTIDRYYGEGEKGSTPQ